MTNPAHRIGRFELRQVIGRGAQSTVWLAHDPRLHRDVALKLMHAGDAGAARLGSALDEARAVASLSHAHIVQVHEADVHRGPQGPQAYLVFEYVPGQSLAQRLQERGAYPPRAAVELMLGVLDALAHAHAAQIVHRDLKPSNILIDGAGQARVTDFGIAVRAASDVQAAGSPRYAAPEALRGAAPTPSLDVFGAGLVLAELMLARPLLDDADAGRAMARVLQEDLRLPASTPEPVDDGLRSIVARALARDPASRFADARQMRDALRAWLAPLDNAPQGDAREGTAAALDFLLRRMRHKTDFPALSDAVGRIQRVTASQDQSLASLAGEILKDVALTQKLLRLVNAASFRHAGGGSISTVSRAVALIGFAGVRNLAMSLVLVEHMNDKLHAEQIKVEFLRALLAGTLAEELAPASLAHRGASEEAFIGAMLCHLGRLLAQFYFAEEAEQVRRLVSPGAALARETPRMPQSEASASTSVLGLSYEELGLGVARHWGLPDSLQQCMRRPEGTPPSSASLSPSQRLRWLSAASNEMADALVGPNPAQAARAMEQAARRHARALEMTPAQIESAVARSRQRLGELARALDIQLRPGSPAQRLLQDALPEAARERADSDTLSGHALTATLPMAADAKAREDDRASMLAAGIQDITNSMVEDFQLNAVLRMILETMLRALGLRRVVLCLRDAKTGHIAGRLAMGEGGDAIAASFKVTLRLAPGAQADLFSAVCLKGADTLISDARSASIASRLPPWYRDGVSAPSFLLLPLALKGSPFGLLYADHAQPGGIVLSERELSLLRTLRNQAVMAFRQASAG